MAELKRAFPLPSALQLPQAGAAVAAQLAGWSVLDDDEADDDEADESGLLGTGAHHPSMQSHPWSCISRPAAVTLQAVMLEPFACTSRHTDRHAIHDVCICVCRAF